MPKVTDANLISIGKIFGKKYGWDIGQATILAVMEMEKRTEILNWMAVANTIARRLARDEYNFYAETLPAGLNAGSNVLDARDPELIIGAREIIEGLDEDFVQFYLDGDVPGGDTPANWKRRQRTKDKKRAEYADSF